MSNSTTIKLASPIEISGAKVDTLTMREPRVKDMRIARKGGGDDADHEVTLFANLCEVTPLDIDNLTLPDYGKLQEAFRTFNGTAET